MNVTAARFFDDEIKVGAVLLRLTESQLKTHLLMRVDKLKKVDRLPRRSGLRFLVRLLLLSHSRHRWTLEQWARENQARDRKELVNVTIGLSKHFPGAEARITPLQTVLTLRRGAENVERLVTWQVCVSILWNSSAPGAKGGQKGKGGKGANAAKTCWHCEEGACDGRVDHCKSGGQSGHHHGWIGRKLLRLWQRE